MPDVKTFTLLIVGGTIATLSVATIFSAKECMTWGGNYSLSAGCLMQIDDKLVSLADYRKITKQMLTKPIETNTVITLKTKE